MPICRVILTEGRSDEAKLALRDELNLRLSRAVNTRPDQINVYFEEHSKIDMPKDGALVRVYLSEGRPDAVKDDLCEAVGTAINQVLDMPMNMINLIITDIPKGDLGVGTKIINRGGIPTALMREGKMADMSAV